jgi:hypothetical protein
MYMGLGFLRVFGWVGFGEGLVPSLGHCFFGGSGFLFIIFLLVFLFVVKLYVITST